MSKNQTFQLNGQTVWIDIFSKKAYKWPMGTWKNADNHLLSGKCKSKPQWDINSHLSEWKLSKRQETTSTSKGVGKKEPTYTVSKNVDWHCHYGKKDGDCSKS